MTRNAAKYRNQPEMIASFLNDALANGETVAFVRTIGDLIHAQGMTEVSRKTGLNRSALYISYEGKHDAQY
jgi:probable addiction module antidote protein